MTEKTGAYLLTIPVSWIPVATQDDSNKVYVDYLQLGIIRHNAKYTLTPAYVFSQSNLFLTVYNAMKRYKGFSSQ